MNKVYKINYKDAFRYYWQFLIFKEEIGEDIPEDDETSVWEVSVSRSAIEFGEAEPFFEYSVVEDKSFSPPRESIILAEFMSKLQYVVLGAHKYSEMKEV